MCLQQPWATVSNTLCSLPTIHPFVHHTVIQVLVKNYGYLKWLPELWLPEVHCCSHLISTRPTVCKCEVTKPASTVVVNAWVFEEVGVATYKMFFSTYLFNHFSSSPHLKVSLPLIYAIKRLLHCQDVSLIIELQASNGLFQCLSVLISSTT